MSSARVVWMVARREIRARMLTKANVISLSVMVALIAVGSLVGGYFLDRDQEPQVSRIALAPAVEALQPHLEAAAAASEVQLEVSTLTAEEARPALEGASGRADPIDAFLDGEPSSPTLVVGSSPDPMVWELVAVATRAFATDEAVRAMGGDPEEFAEATTGAVPTVEAIEPPDEEVDGPAFGVAMAMISLLFGALIGTGSMISMGVVEEKTSRVVEVLLSTIKPSQLLAGKILGIGAYGLFQVLVLGGALALGALHLGVDALAVDVGSALLSLVVWFLVGYLLYALLFGGFAALVSRQEDIGTVTTPLMFLLFVPFYTTMFLVPNDPDGTLVRILSPIPFFSPFMVPVREALGAIALWETLLALGISLLTVPALVWVAARVYQRGVLHTGGRIKLTEALRGGPAPSKASAATTPVGR